MESDLQQQYQNHQQQQPQMGSPNLMRYRSAPSSYFTNFIDDSESYLEGNRPSSPETDQIIAQFMSEETKPRVEFKEIRKNSTHSQVNENQEMQQEFMGSPPVMYQSSTYRPPLPNQTSKTTDPGSDMERSGSVSADPYKTVASMAQAKLGGANSSLVRHSSSPAGLFANLNVENGYGVMRGMGNYGSVTGTNGQASFSSTSRLKGEINFSSGPPSSSGLTTHLTDIGNKSLRTSSPEDGTFDDGHNSNSNEYLTGFPVGSWEDTGAFLENYNSLKRSRDDDRKNFSGLSESQNGEHGSPVLSHHMSMPKTSAEMSSMEKYLQFQDSVPCKIRAKRGCATHPRSIAERVRRTRISERMRKLQELVPNMDKQTSTADMLDLAVDYIKDLQKQVKTLKGNRAKCTCSSNSGHE